MIEPANKETLMNFKATFLLIGLTATLALKAPAEDVYLDVPITSLTFTEGALPTTNAPMTYQWERFEVFQPYAVLDREAEVYYKGDSARPWMPPTESYRAASLAIRTQKDSEIAGELFVPKPDLSGMMVLKFKTDAAAIKQTSKTNFYQAKEAHFRNLRERNIPGAAWFRYQETEAAKARGGKASGLPTGPGRFARGRMPEESIDAAYEHFSGGRAVSENLQLDRLFPPAGSNAVTVDISTLQGITTREMDWKPLIKDCAPKKDFLADYIPHDQHALFFPSFAALTRWIDEADSDGTPVLQIFEPRAEDQNSRSRYQKQLCLELNDLSRLLGPAVIASAAVTGSDPFLRTGTDLGVLYETRTPEVLKTFIQAKYTAAQQSNPAVKAVTGELKGVGYSGVISPERAVSSYLAALEKVVIVCNSTNQLAGLINVAKGKHPALAAQDEYVFFRSRYPAGADQETAFLVLSDATIRRWCSPRWRIGNARRTTVAAVLADLQAAHFTELVAGTVKPGPLEAPSEAGEVLLTPTGVVSSTYGTLDFLTPISELPLTKVTQAEADAYKRWCQGYQQNWSQFFDPIAIRFSMGPRELSAELTVMPLIAGSEYRHVIDVSSGAKIPPDAGDRHPEALLHLAFALNAESQPIKESGNFLGNFVPSLKANPLGWLGQSVAIYADKDPFWVALGKAEKGEDFLERNYAQLPLALHCDVKNPLGLATFLTALRGFVEQTAPKMTTWENLEYKNQAYVKVTSREEGTEGGPTNLCVYYTLTPKSLTVTLSESVLKRALDRQNAHQEPKADTKSTATSSHPWLGTNLCLQVSADFLPAIESMSQEAYRSSQQMLCWNNLPILNEWKRLFPDQDPVKLHERFWQTRLLCPGGGSYVWNAQWHTMESTVYGHPGEPKPGPNGIPLLAKFSGANLGLSFENQGLSAKVVLDRDTKKP